MRLLLDTHVLVWLAEGRAELRRAARRAIEDAESVAVSSLSFWEIAMLATRGRLALGEPLLTWRRRVLAASIEEIAVTGDIGIEAVTLPGKLHGDPADRIIAATARLAARTLVTHDARLLAFGSEGHLPTISA